jgi:putative ABC transport system permease protein
MAPALREVIRSIDANVPIFSVSTIEEIFRRSAAAQIGIFNLVFSSTAIMGFFLALVGLYGVVAYQVERRTREIGIRMALGAERFEVLRMILKQAAVIAGVAIIVGLGLSVLVRPALLASMGRPRSGGPLSGFDPTLFVFLPLALLFMTLFATAIPARRASQVDPQHALRQD